MPQIRTLGVASALVAAGVMVLSSVAAAHDGPHFGRWDFDNRWVGTEGDDEYTAPEDSRDLIIGLAGNDVLKAGDRRDVIRGNAGDDVIHGGPGMDRIKGGFGNDRLAGGGQSDKRRILANVATPKHMGVADGSSRTGAGLRQA